MSDRREIVRKALGEIFWAPITWVPFVPSMGLVAFAGLPWWGNLLALGAPAVFVASNWSFSWPRLLKVVTGREALARAQAEEKACESLGKKLRGKRLIKESTILESARQIIAAMEKFNTEQATEQSLRIAVTAGKVFDQMRAEMQAALDEPASEDRRSRLQASLRTLEESLQMVERQAQLLEKIAQRGPEDRLAELQDQLQSENQIAENVINRLEGDTQENR